MLIAVVVLMAIMGLLYFRSRYDDAIIRLRRDLTSLHEQVVDLHALRSPLNASVGHAPSGILLGASYLYQRYRVVLFGVA